MGNQCRCVANKQVDENEIGPERPHQDGNETQPGETLASAEQPNAPSQKDPSPPDDEPLEDPSCAAQTKKSITAERRGGRVEFLLPRQQNSERADNVVFEEQAFDKNQLPQITKTLKKHFILSQLNEKEISYVVKKMKMCRAAKNSYIFKQADPSFSYYVILEGECKVEINGKPKKRLVAGDSFGDLGIIYSAPRSASILAEEDCVLAELNRGTFKKIISDLNSIQESENRKALENLEFYNLLTETQKNVLAADCISEVYESGEVIFNKGDDANAFYIVLEGIASIVEKKIDFKVGENVGSNAIIQNDNAVRSGTLIAKTKCKLLSITKAKIRDALGDSIGNIIQKNMVVKVVQESNIAELIQKDKWAQVIEAMQMVKLEKGAKIFSKGEKVEDGVFYVLLSTDVRDASKKKCYMANTVIEEMKVYGGKNFSFSEDFFAEGEGYVGKAQMPDKKAEKAMEIAKLHKKESEELRLEDFILVRKLRAGNFGQLYACYNRATQKKYAVKVMNKVKLAKESVISYVYKEEEILGELPEHPFVIKFYRMFVLTDFVILVIQLYEGQDLFDAFGGNLTLSPPQIRLYLSQIILMMEHLHKNKVIYRDLKPENLMLDEDGYLNLVDFGTAKKLTIEHRYKTMTIIGTPHYMAPEIITGKGYSFAADWWSIGVLLYEMISGKLPFGEFADDPFTIYEEILKQEILFPRYIDSATKQMVEKLLTKNPQHRWGDGFDALKKYPYFSKTNWTAILEKKEKSTYTPPKSCQIGEVEVRKCLKKKNNSLLVFLEKQGKTSPAQKTFKKIE